MGDPLGSYHCGHYMQQWRKGGKRHRSGGGGVHFLALAAAMHCCQLQMGPIVLPIIWVTHWDQSHLAVYAVAAENEREY